MVQIKLNAEGQVVTAYQGNADFGYVILNSTESVFQNGWLQQKERSAIIKGETAMLAQAFATIRELDGKIAVTECIETAIPAKFSVQFNKDITFEENVEPYIKRAGEGGPILLDEDGNKILRFTEYDPSGHIGDVRIQHANGDEVKAFNATKSTAKAKL